MGKTMKKALLILIMMLLLLAIGSCKEKPNENEDNKANIVLIKTEEINKSIEWEYEYYLKADEYAEINIFLYKNHVLIDQITSISKEVEKNKLLLLIQENTDNIIFVVNNSETHSIKSNNFMESTIKKEMKICSEVRKIKGRSVKLIECIFISQQEEYRLILEIIIHEKEKTE